MLCGDSGTSDDWSEPLNRIQSVASALLISILISIVFVWCVEGSPQAFFDAWKHTFLNPFGLGYTLYYTTPLIFTGLSAALCFQAGLFNIGSEGQLLWGAIGIVALSSFFPNLPPGVAIPLAALASGVFGAVWGLIPGYLRAKRGSHEVITTILLNFIASSLVSYCILYPLKSTTTQAAETFSIPNSYQISNIWFPTTPFNTSFFLALVCALLVYLVLNKTVFGFEIKAMGANPRAARFSGIPISKRMVQVFLLSGFLSGLVGVNEVMGAEHKVIEGFSPGYGFTGIAVALLARNHPLGIVLSSFLIGSLQNFSRELEFFGNWISKEYSIVLQAFLILLIASRTRKKGERSSP